MREKLLELLIECLGEKFYRPLVEGITDYLISKDVAVQTNAYWERFRWPSGTHGIRCSNCKVADGRKWPFCHNCGAKMIVEDNDGT